MSTEREVPPLHLGDLVATPRIKALVYGKSGVGKTWGAGTFPRTCFMDFDSGIRTLTNPEFIAAHGKVKTMFQRFTEHGLVKGGVPKTHNAYDDACDFFDTMMKRHADDFDTWVIDTATSLSEIAMNKAVVLLGSTAYKKMSETHSQSLTSGLLVPKIQDYGAERSLVEQFVDMVLSTDKHVLLLAHEKEMVNDAGVVKSVEPLLTGRSSEVVAGMFDDVWNLKVTGSGPSQKRVLMTHTNGIVKAKSRTGVPNDTPFEYRSLAPYFFPSTGEATV